MFTLISRITVKQVNKVPYVGRDKSYTFYYNNGCEGTSTWAHLTDEFVITLPRKIYFKDSEGNKIEWASNTDIYGNPDKSPLITRGDKIKIELGYIYYSSGGIKKLVANFNTEFEGFVTKIENKMPFVLHCEDNMYVLKQTRVPDKVYPSSAYSIETMLKEMLLSNPDAKDFTVDVDTYQHSTGDFIAKGVTMAQCLDEIRKNYKLESWFRPKGTALADGNGNATGKSTTTDSLRCGIIRYYPNERINHILHFQKNIASDTLNYTRDNDVKIGIKAFSIFKTKVQAISAGKFKIKQSRLETNVGDTDGEIRTLYFPDITTVSELQKQANVALPYIKYEGFRGTVTTFGLPYIKHGDSVTLINSLLPELSGTYLVKAVKVSFGLGGYRRTLELDIRIDGLSSTQLSNFQKFGL